MLMLTELDLKNISCIGIPHPGEFFFFFFITLKPRDE